jgi:nucleotide-binding universal stress UspA family protein
MSQIPTILTSLALSPRASAVAAEGLRLAAVFSAEAIFVHVGQDTPDIRDSLNRTLKAAGAENVPAERILIRSGHPGRTICEAARQTKSEMIVMGALDRDPPLVRVWGSVARYVARRAPCSVMLLPDPQSQHTAMQRIVAGVGTDAQSAAMVPLLLQLARSAKQAQLYFVREFSVAEARWAQKRGAGSSGEWISGHAEYIRQLSEDQQRELDEFLGGFDMSGVEVRTAGLAGYEGVEVISYARRQHADLLALPAPLRRLTIWDRFFRHPLELALRQLPCGLLLFRSSPV